MSRAAVIVVVIAACNGDGAPTKQGATPRVPNSPSAPSGTDAAAPARLGGGAPSDAGTTAPSDLGHPADQRCLPVNVCDEWVGCGVVAPATTAWKVIVADRFAPGDAVDVVSVCTSGDSCPAIRGIPAGITCKPWTTPIYIKPPDYTCRWDGSACRRG